MRRSLSYADAVRVLGGKDNKTVTALDRLTGGLLLIASAAGSGLALSLFDGKGELARLGGELLARLDQRVSGVSQFDRSERVAAAHAIIVVTAYFEALARIELLFDANEIGLTRTDEVRLAGGAPDSARLQALAAELLHADVPMPGPQSPHEATVENLRRFYEQLSSAVLRFIFGLSIWDRLDETRRARVQEALEGVVPDRAVHRYEESLRRLAVDCPEVAFWTSLINHQATREQLRSLDRSLAGLEHMLSLLIAGRMPDQRRVELSRYHRAALARPILTSGEVPDGLGIPSLEDGYINPDFRAADVAPSDRVAEESWWDQRPLRHDLQEFLLGHLTSPQATLAPLLVLGQPGSGKSLLTRLLAARLPAEAFLAVRVALRDVPADSDVQTQIEHGVRAATGEQVSWPDLARSAGDALPVVLLDGFDELLQATGVSQSDYLERVATLQRREADHGRPVAVLVTSRTAVADRARPTAGTVAVRLEPFGEKHVRRWLESWNAANESFFAARGLRGLEVDTVLRHAELASQPLLLLMLALYDVDENRLQREDVGLSRAELYERLLTQFAKREVRKAGAALPEAEFEREIERELLRLSVAAFAMFNRNRQWTTEAEFDADLSALLDEWRQASNTSGLRAPLTPAAVVIGRFFFVHQAQAIQDNAELRTFEFLHSTFGEYLIARLVAQELRHLAHGAELDLARTRHSPIDDAFLHALLSYAPLTIRDTAVAFLRQLLETEISQHDRLLLRDVLLVLFRDALLRAATPATPTTHP
jgi:hypothetical protein